MSLLVQRAEYLKQRGLAISELKAEYAGIIKDGIWQHITEHQRDIFLHDIVTKGKASPLGLRLQRGCRIMQYEELLNKYIEEFSLIRDTQNSINEVPTFHLDGVYLRASPTADYNVALIAELVALHPELSHTAADCPFLSLDEKTGLQDLNFYFYVNSEKEFKEVQRELLKTHKWITGQVTVSSVQDVSDGIQIPEYNLFPLAMGVENETFNVLYVLGEYHTDVTIGGNTYSFCDVEEHCKRKVWIGDTFANISERGNLESR